MTTFTRTKGKTKSGRTVLCVGTGSGARASVHEPGELPDAAAEERAYAAIEAQLAQSSI